MYNDECMTLGYWDVKRCCFILYLNVNFVNIYTILMLTTIIIIFKQVTFAIVALSTFLFCFEFHYFSLNFFVFFLFYRIESKSFNKISASFKVLLFLFHVFVSNCFSKCCFRFSFLYHKIVQMFFRNHLQKHFMKKINSKMISVFSTFVYLFKPKTK